MHTQEAAPPIEHAERTYQAFPGANYLLPSDAHERERYNIAFARRLNLQHSLLKQAFNNRIILPPITIAASDRILDSGTGSGSWLIDVLGAVPPTAKLYGLDIECRLFPSDDSRVTGRGHVEFCEGTVTNLPEDWDNMFALVHQRLLMAALKPSEWKQAIAEIFRVLVPGGWVQLGEADGVRGGAVTAKHVSLVQTLFQAKGLLLHCAAHIPDMLREAGFVNVTVETANIPLGKWAGPVGVDARNNFMGVFRGMKTPVLKAGGLGFVTTEGEWDTSLDSLEEEWDATPGAVLQFDIFYAMKPIPSVF
ncbi:S-adenosyl-L-methionine-dependent methyltransferase [Rhodofomes roseus]|uniref:S-adenosyl-L-methionine-dependent methyltransferase n=1 Tax=Rhodofomes roseus TaxID=34475 RepID=A0ABQ8KSR8_9APHY|nr:S-adenosyl-L-methionine-dependent methyltransferase [Rhodofomes roseus]KAH9841865.1 S-adenosyl-L-methionine-dependent methyltransferase [Rhodofomes roseus]